MDIDEYDSLATYAQAGDAKCQELLISYCGRLVHSFAVDPSISDTILEYTDLMQCGYIGVLEALPNWQLCKGHFSTYVVFYIRRNINNYVGRTRTLIHIRSQHHATLAASLPYLRMLCEEENKGSISTEHLATWINENGYSKNIKNGNITSSDINRMEQISTVISLDTFHTDEEGLLLTDVIACPNTPDPSEHIIALEDIKERKSLVSHCLNSLTYKQ